jgi:hypothetical protein
LVGDCTHGRQANATVLADGRILVTGGSAVDKDAGLAFGSGPWSLEDEKLNDWNGGRGFY